MFYGFVYHFITHKYGFDVQVKTDFQLILCVRYYFYIDGFEAKRFVCSKIKEWNGKQLVNE